MKKLFAVIALIMLTGCNKQIIDLNYKFNKAIINIGEEVIEVEIVSWRDYEDSEQVQITTVDGAVYLTSSYNCILVKEGD